MDSPQYDLVSAVKVALSGLATPRAPTITNIGTAGSTGYTYKVVARLSDGSVTAASSGGATTTGHAILNTVQFNRITWSKVEGAYDYAIYRTASSGTPSSTGLIGTTTGTTFDDTGIAGDSATAPTVNTTGLISGAAIAILEGGSNPTYKTYLRGGDQAADINYTLPINDGDADQVLATNGAGVLDWVTPAGGGGGAVSIIDVNSTQVGNTAMTETDLVSKSVAGDTLATNGETIEFYAAGTFAQTFTQSDLKVKFGATTIFDGSGFKSTLANGRWELRGSIVRTGAATQKTSVTMIYSQEAGSIGYTSGDVVAPAIQVTTVTETLASASILKITGNGTGANDVVFEFWKVVKVAAS